MVRAVRRGASIRAVARKYRFDHTTVRLWVERAQGQRLDRVDFSDRPSAPRRCGRTPAAVEDFVLALRHTLHNTSALGEHGAVAIRTAMLAQGIRDVPALRTVGRILERRGVLDGRYRRRFPPPPRGWHLPGLCRGQKELDSFDIIEDLRIENGPFVDILTGVAFFGNGVLARPMVAPVTAKQTLAWLLEYWRLWGLPAYAQFDNDTRFQGAHHHRDSVSRVMRVCLGLGITPVFAPPRETGFQAAIENFNGRWQRAVWQRFHHANLASVCEKSETFTRALSERWARRVDQAPARLPFPSSWRLDLQKPPCGTIIYIRRTSATGEVSLLGRTFFAADQWPHRLVRCHVDLDNHSIRCFALRRRDPLNQPLLREIEYHLPNRPFHE